MSIRITFVYALIFAMGLVGCVYISIILGFWNALLALLEVGMIVMLVLS